MEGTGRSSTSSLLPPSPSFLAPCSFHSQLPTPAGDAALPRVAQV